MNDDQKQTKPKPKSRKHNLDREGALKPDINVKVDELFIRCASAGALLIFAFELMYSS